MDLADEIVGKADGLGKLGRGHVLCLAAKADVLSYGIVDVLVKNIVFHSSYHLTKVYPLGIEKYVRS